VLVVFFIATVPNFLRTPSSVCYSYGHCSREPAYPNLRDPIAGPRLSLGVIRNRAPCNLLPVQSASSITSPKLSVRGGNNYYGVQVLILNLALSVPPQISQAETGSGLPKHCPLMLVVTWCMIILISTAQDPREITLTVLCLECSDCSLAKVRPTYGVLSVLFASIQSVFVNYLAS